METHQHVSNMWKSLLYVPLNLNTCIFIYVFWRYINFIRREMYATVEGSIFTEEFNLTFVWSESVTTKSPANSGDSQSPYIKYQTWQDGNHEWQVGKDLKVPAILKLLSNLLEGLWKTINTSERTVNSLPEIQTKYAQNTYQMDYQCKPM